MTTPNVHPFYMSWIRDEFGGTEWGNPMWLSWYYAGGSWVPAGTTGVYGAIPSSGYTTVDHYRNASKYIYNGNLNAGQNGTYRGFWNDLSMGSLSPTALAGTDIRACMWSTDGSTFHLFLWGNIGNAGFNEIIVNGSYVLSRGSGYFSIYAGGSAWSWGGVGNPFTVGANHTLNFR